MRRLLTLVSATVLLESMFFAVLAPLLPYYEDEFGLSTSALGALSAVYALGALAGALPSGLFAVRIGVKATVLTGLALIVVTSVAFGLAESAWLLYAARFGQGVGAAFAWTGGLAWLIAAAPSERRGELIGIAMGSAIAGALLGPVLGGVASVVGPGPAFAAVAAMGIVLGAWAWTTPAFKPAEEPQPLRALRGAPRVREVVSGFWLVSLAAFLLGIISVVAPLRLDELGWGALGISAAFLISAGIEAALSPVHRPLVRPPRAHGAGAHRPRGGDRLLARDSVGRPSLAVPPARDRRGRRLRHQLGARHRPPLRRRREGGPRPGLRLRPPQRRLGARERRRRSTRRRARPGSRGTRAPTCSPPRSAW